jgi:ABC-2 type transport system ATP-binding protein
MDKNIALQVRNVSKSFKLPIESAKNFKQFTINKIKGIKGYRNLEVINNLTFTVNQGDFYGIVGRNGSGKSTLLKLLAGIYTPDSGEIEVNGSLVPFIELGVGFNPELSGRENVYLNCSLLGFPRKQIDKMYKEIVDFAELSEFMEQKLKNYSSGMQVRLAFSVAIMAQGDILILDEILAVGDETFQQKCFSYFAKLKQEKKTVILVTHNMGSVQDFCNKALIVDKSGLIQEGNPAEISQLYRKLNEPQQQNEPEVAVEDLVDEHTTVSLDLKRTLDDELLHLEADLVSTKDISNTSVSVVIRKETGEWVYRWTSDERIGEGISFTKGVPKKLSLDIQNVFPDGVFYISYYVKSLDRTVEYEKYDDIAKFNIAHSENTPQDKYWKPREDYSFE